MTKAQIKEILERILTWPPERQEDLANIALSMESSDAEPLELTPEEIADLEEAVREMDRGEVATDEEVAAVFRRRL